MALLKFAARLVLALLGIVIGLSLASALAALVMRPRLAGRPEPGDDEVDLGAVYDTLVFRSEATAFRGGRIICWYSGMDIDLRRAALDPAGADLAVWTLYGGTRIRVPESWRVASHGVTVFSGATSTAAPPTGDSEEPVLRVRHRTLFGGFAVTVEPNDEDLAA